MHIGKPSNAAQLLQLAQATNIAQKHESSDAFNKALMAQQNTTNSTTNITQGSTSANPLHPNANNGTGSTLPGTDSSVNSSGGTTSSGSSTSTSSTGSSGASTTAAGKALAGTMFNAAGNLTSGSTIPDLKVLNQQNVLLQQVLTMSRNISATQAAALQPSVMLSIGMLSRLYALLEQTKKRTYTSANNNASILNAQVANSDDLAAAQQSQILSFVFIERLLKLFDPEKHLQLARYFKKGPLGENEHDTDTDDEYGDSFADIDAETDYIKRPRKDRPGMAFHQSMIT